MLLHELHLQKQKLKSNNRLYNTLWGLLWDPRKLATARLQEREIDIIWSWVGDDRAFFRLDVHDPGAPADPAPPDDAGPFAPGLHSVCNLLGRMTTQRRIDKVRGRLLQYLLARFVDQVLPDVKDVGELARLMVESGWIARGLTRDLEEDLRGWLAGGRVYGKLALGLGGPGVLIHLPLIGSSAWESHCHPEGPYGTRNLDTLRRIGVHETAHEGRWAPKVDRTLNAHEVVNALVDDLLRKCQVYAVHFVTASDGTPQPSRSKRSKRTKLRRPHAVPYPSPVPPIRAERSASGHSHRTPPPYTPPGVSPPAFSPTDASLSGQVPLFSAHSPLSDNCHVLASPPILFDGEEVEPFPPSNPVA